jgi:hypothetical protein
MGQSACLWQLWPCDVQRLHRHPNQPAQQLHTSPNVGRPQQQPCMLPACRCCLLLLPQQMLRLTGDITDLHDAKVIMKFAGLPTHCCAWGKDGKHVLAAGDDGTVRVALMPHCKVRQHTPSVPAYTQLMYVSEGHSSQQGQEGVCLATSCTLLYCTARVLHLYCCR